ncbi:polymer-forming cytoskeletal protein [Microbulbifer sp. A4B17]|uniref:bactofilin family protein n=1 Tax=Microbulbifer sp. A4B17 TaxID=359370 RepID=UPI000D52C99E|nr:polymer-forming cytoskeletal protein [Microbulbifer sp. A4B17]AWF80884.1 polymer-forming cytoskeletal protein [Microbulbifer sp. A4B17]
MSTDKSNDSTPFLAGMSAVEQQSSLSGSGSKSVLGEGINFRGELIGTEDLHVEGTVDGTVIMVGHNLSVGTGGAVTANIHAKNIVVEGTLDGDALADELIEIRNTAQVNGNLIAPRIKLDDGGKFRGSMDMVDTDSEMKERHKEFSDRLVHPDLPAAEEKPAARTRGSSTYSSSTTSTSDSSRLSDTSDYLFGSKETEEEAEES